MAEASSKDKILEVAKRYVDEGRVDRAIQEYQKLLATDPRDYRVKLRVAELYVRQKQMAEAVRVYQEVAQAYADEGFYLKAVTVYKNILKLNPSLRDVNARLADLYEKMGLATDAVHQYQILISLYEQRGDSKGILDLRRRIVALDPTNVANRLRLAEAYQIDGQDQTCLQEYETLAEQLKDSGSGEQLIDLYEKILTRRPDHLELLQRLCRIYFQQKEYKKALRRIEASQAVASKDPELAEMQAEMYFRQNQMETAKGKWRELVDLYRGMGAMDAALTVCERILAAAPDEAEEISALADGIKPGAAPDVRAKAEARRHAMAVAETEAEAVVTPPPKGEAGAKTVASATKQAGAPGSSAPPRGAETRLGVAKASAMLNKAKASEHLARMYRQTGLTDEARAEWQKALEWYRQVETGAADAADVATRIAGIEAELQGGASEAASIPTPTSEPKSPVSVPVSKPPPTSSAGTGKSPSPKARPPSPSQGKKRISFV
ncbi:MAG: tetratricopeptide repeat protein [Deltaproteobacteria bacterium]|nr:tetratricopeptide repeat protein [Deltaproteobacteria bacterium]